jgi:hypothetical protein
MAKRILLCVLVFLSTSAAAFGYGTTTTYSDISWFFSSNASPFSFNSCDNMLLDATGDWTNSDKFILYGYISCPNTTFIVTGSGYRNNLGGLSFVIYSGGDVLRCDLLSTLSGTCTVLDIASNTVAGSASISLQ